MRDSEFDEDVKQCGGVGKSRWATKLSGDDIIEYDRAAVGEENDVFDIVDRAFQLVLDERVGDRSFGECVAVGMKHGESRSQVRNSEVRGRIGEGVGVAAVSPSKISQNGDVCIRIGYGSS